MSEIASIQTSQMQSSACIAARAGTFLLTSGHAMSLKPQHASVLRITCGTAWVTVQRTGLDHMLCANEQLPIERGDHVVIESLHQGHVKLDWQTLPCAVSLAAQARLQALRDLRGAAVLLARGLGGGFKALALTAHSSASRAQGRMASGESMASSGAV
jgi:Protein of unknown function (DUF2917)